MGLLKVKGKKELLDNFAVTSDCLHAVRTYMTESIQTEIIMLSIAYMPFVPTVHDRKHTNRNNHV